jgi:hypothetical protein
MSKSIDIFIRTYKNDLPWLQYCLKSIHKYVTGYRRIVVCIPEDQVGLLRDFNLKYVHTCPVYKDDYLGQQISKLKADVYCESEYVLYVDSDCVFNRPLDVSKNLFYNDKPVVYKTRYEKVGEAICWKAITEKSINKRVEWEYMRRLPILYRSETITDFRDYMELIHNRTLEEYIIKQPLRQYSEFNALGAFTEAFYPEGYHFHDTEYGIEAPYLKQNWSWGGLTPEIRKDLEEICA